MLISNIWDGAEMLQPLTILGGKCSMKYFSVYTDERCLFPFSLWEMVKETSNLVVPTIPEPVTPMCGP